jgi:hypothetical protein
MSTASNWYYSHRGPFKEYRVQVHSAAERGWTPEDGRVLRVLLALERQDGRHAFVRLSVEEARQLIEQLEQTLRRHGVVPRVPDERSTA